MCDISSWDRRDNRRFRIGASYEVLQQGDAGSQGFTGLPKPAFVERCAGRVCICAAKVDLGRDQCIQYCV